MTSAPAGVSRADVPARSGLVLVSLILVAAVANLNLAVANVALPDIGRAFDSSQTTLDLVAVGYSLGLAASVLYLGALGDRYGRKLMLLLGVGLSVPACLLAALAPSDEILIAARLLGGLSAGMAYPTTLALITALWSGPGRTRSIALWSGIGGAISALGPLTAGALLQHFYWGSVFLVTLPLAAVAFVLAVMFVPSHVNETSDPVDNLGGVLSAVLVAAVVLGINFAAVPDKGALVIGLAAVALAAGVGFVIRQRRARAPLYDLQVAGRRVFWVAAVAGIIVFGSLMGAMFIGQQFLQNVLGYSSLEAGAAILPAAAFMVLIAPRSAKLVDARGARFTLLTGYVFCLLGFLTMLVLWQEGIAYWGVALGYSFMGVGVGFAGTPASHSLTGSVPVTRAGMASGTADLQRDLGGAIMQSILGALLTAGYASAIGAAIAGAPASDQQLVTDSVQTELQNSFASASETASRYPQYADQITAAARSSFVDGADWAYLAGIVAVVLGAALVFLLFPKKQKEEALLDAYAREDGGAGSTILAVDPVPWARAQMAFTLGAHIILVPLGVSWAFMTLVANHRGIKRNDADAMRLAQRWSKYLAVTFAVGAVTGTVLTFEFGLLWPEFMGRYGDAFGIPFAFEGLFFFVEAIFIAIYIYGWKRMKPWPHFWAGVPIVICGIGGTISVVAANAWMNEPAGFTLENGEVVDVDPLAVIFNDAMPYEAAHMLVAAYLVGGFLVASVYAVGMLRGRRDRYHRLGFIIPFTVAAIATPVQMLVGDTLARWVYENEPTKFAAIELVPETKRGVPETLLGRLGSDGEVSGGIPIPGLASWLSDPSTGTSTVIQGLDAVPADERPTLSEVNTVHLAWDVMVGLGTLLSLLSVWYALSWVFRRDFPKSKWFLRAAAVAGVAAVLAMEAGWVVTEVGRQPYIVAGHMKVEEAATGNEGVWITFLVVAAIYVTVGITTVLVLRAMSRRFRAGDDAAVPYGPRRPAPVEAGAP